MCSKVNSPDAETCAYCGARLKAVRPASAPSPASPPPASPKGDQPDWLHQIRQDASPASQGSAEETPAQANEPDDVPDWLSRIRSRESDASVNPTDTGDAGFFSPSETPAGQVDAPDWLRGLEEDQAGGQSSATAGAQESFGLGDDWFSRLNDPQAPAASGGDLSESDWMQGLPESSEQGFGGTPDWSSDNTGTSFAFNAPSDSQPASEPEAVSDDDWMSKLSGWQTTPAEQAPSTPSIDWDAPAQQPPSPAAGDQDELGWLSGLGFDAEEPKPSGGETLNWDQPVEPEPERQSSGFGMTDFLSGLDEKPSGQPEAESSFDFSMPAQDDAAQRGEAGGFDWSQFAAANEETPAPSSGAGTEEPSAGWLSGLQAETSPEAGPGDGEGGDWFQRFDSAAEATPEPAGEPGIPEWLRGGPGDASAPAAAPSGEEGLPSWLSGDFGATDQPSAPAEPPTMAETPPAAETGLPDWLSGGQEQEAAGAAAAAAGAIPIWLSGEEEPPEEPSSLSMSFDAAEPAVTEAAPEAADVEAELPDWFSSFGEPSEQVAESEPSVSDTQPDWLAGVAETPMVVEQPQAEAAEPAPAPFIDENVPDWLRDFNAQQPPASDVSASPLIGMEEMALPQGESEQPFGMEELPDWLAEDAATRAAETSASDRVAAQAGEEQELARADLPEWVRDMRPIESLVPGEPVAAENDQRVERAGPLAGMPGVLPAEEMVSHYRKLPTYSVKLRVTEKQRSHAALLENILAQETQAKPIPPQRSLAPRVIMHILVALLLLFALSAPRFFEMEALVVPAGAPGELQDMFKTIDEAMSQQTAPVLLAVDYEPGLSGEMRLTAAPIVEHLMTRNANLVVVSTVPSGPALAQRLLTDAGKNHTAYNLETQIVNLGYLPGGTISLLEFARQPQLAAPVTLYGASAWQNPVLSQVVELQDFSQVIVLTDSPETGRAWVEQVQPLMGDVPLLMVASAQAAPMLEPYVQSGQVAGMVSGMLGGLMYGQQAGQASSAVSPHFASYQIGVLLAFFLVLAGGLVSGVRAMIAGRGKEEE